MGSGSPELSPGARLVVVSPHLDDAVLSLGATIARAVRRGVGVSVVTALACDPDSAAPTRGWDSRAGFATEGDAARARRVEDAAACAALGAVPVWLPFGSVDYERHADDEGVVALLADRLEAADAVLLPGAPLSHADHAWLVRALLGSGLRARRLGFYVEQPYAARADDSTRAPDPPAWLADALPVRLELTRLSAGPRDWLLKRRAVRCYRSQLPLLALDGGARLERHLFSQIRSGGERLGWLESWSGQALTIDS